MPTRNRYPSRFFIPLSLLLPAYSLAEKNDTRSENALEEIVVTAQLREKNLLTLPMAIDLYDAGFLAASSAKELDDLELAAPSLHFGRSGRKTRGEIGIRGISDFARNIGGSGRVAVYVDEVPLSRSSAFNSSLSDIKHIEVAKGPQGTLAGTNSISGAIHIITAEPGDEFSADINQEFGSNNYYLAAFRTTLPLSNTFSSSLQIQQLHSDGYVKNLANKKDMQGDDADSAKIKFRYTPHSQWKIVSSFDWLEEDRLAINSEALTEFVAVPVIGSVPNNATQANEVAHNADEREYRKIWGGMLKSDYTLDSGYRWLSISGLRASQFDETSEEDYTEFPVASSNFNEDYRQLSQEFRLLSKMTESFDYLGGLFLLDSETSSDRSAQLGPTRVLTEGKLDETITAFYAHGNYRFAPQWELSLGTRYQHNALELDYAITDSTGQFTNGELQDKKSFNAWLPSLSVNFYPARHASTKAANNPGLIYASVARGTKRGGWNTDFVSSLDIDFSEEYATSYELGYKDQFFDQRLRLQAALYQSNFTDFQVFQFLFAEENSPPQITLTNAGEATSKGFEFALETQIHPFITHTINAAWNSARFDKFEQGDGAGTDYSGNYLPWAPRKKMWTGLDFTLPDLLADTIRLHIDYSYSDGYFSNANNLDAFSVGRSHTINSRLQVQINAHCSVALWGKNLSNEKILRSRDVSFLGIQRGLYEAQRSVGLSLEIGI